MKHIKLFENFQQQENVWTPFKYLKSNKEVEIGEEYAMMSNDNDIKYSIVKIVKIDDNNDYNIWVKFIHMDDRYAKSKGFDKEFNTDQSFLTNVGNLKPLK